MTKEKLHFEVMQFFEFIYLNVKKIERKMYAILMDI